MTNRAFLLMSAAVVGCLLTPLLAAAFIGVPPQTLGSMCRMPDHIAVLHVDKVSADGGVIVFKHVEQLKGKYHGGGTKLVIPANVKGAKVIRDWAAEAKTAVMFYFWQGKGIGYVCIDSAWCQVYSQIGHASKTDPPDISWYAAQVEPAFLAMYCGTADKLRDAVKRILKGEEVAVPAIVGENRRAVEEGRAKVQDILAGLKLVGANEKPNTGDNKKPGTKPEADSAKPGEKPAALVGTVKAVFEDGKRFTLVPAATEKNKQPTAVEIGITKSTTVTPNKLAVGQTVSVWLEKGDAKVATTIQIGKPTEKPVIKPVPGKSAKPGADATPAAPRKPRAPAGPVRDPSPTAAVIDAEVDRLLAKEKIPASPAADDAEFLRRVTLDLTGRIPTYQQTVAFLDSKDPNKRRKLIDELLNSDQYGDHFANIWRNLLTGRTAATGEKGGVNNDTLRPWLADQFNDNRGWNAIVTDLLIAEGTPRDNPATAFLMTHGENGRPQPNKVTGVVGSLFWGMNLRCAECHKHPFANWKQDDFWGTAAFFGKLQYGGKGGPPSLAESLTGVAATKEKGAPPAPMVRGAAIVIPTSSGKAAGQVVKARFLNGNEPTLDEKEPFRPRFAEWATAADNPYFAKATVNRMWAHFFGRGFANPLDSLDTVAPSHPELLDRLTKEFASSGFDLKHLARCITTSKAYQRTSRPIAGNEGDPNAFSRVAVKALTPEVLYDALGIIGKESGSNVKGGKGGGDRLESRDLFLKSFRVDDDAAATEYIQGIPQLLRMMNASSPNRGAAVVENLLSSKSSRPEAITTLYLTVLSRRPSAEEVELMSGYLARRKDDREGYRGVMWILLNSSEFALNH